MDGPNPNANTTASAIAMTNASTSTGSTSSTTQLSNVNTSAAQSPFLGNRHHPSWNIIMNNQPPLTNGEIRPTSPYTQSHPSSLQQYDHSNTTNDGDLGSGQGGYPYPRFTPPRIGAGPESSHLKHSVVASDGTLQEDQPTGDSHADLDRQSWALPSSTNSDYQRNP